MKWPSTHQELFDWAVLAKQEIHLEFSCERFNEDQLKLMEWADKYAKVHGLIVPNNWIER